MHELMSWYTNDIRQDVISNRKGWVPLFGQDGSAQSHLKNQDVKKGDLFLFFGRFKEVELVNSKYKYKKDSHSKHVIFGYLEIGEIYDEMKDIRKLFPYHPHAQSKFEKSDYNCIYKGKEHLTFLPSYKGAGCLQFNKDLILTKSGYSMSKWELPNFFKDVNITYHTSNSFKTDYFQSVGRGQEFVIEENDKVTDWAKKIIMQGLGKNNQ